MRCEVFATDRVAPCTKDVSRAKAMATRSTISATIVGLCPGPRSSADRAEDFPTADPAPTSHYLQGSGGEVVGRAMGVRRTSHHE